MPKQNFLDFVGKSVPKDRVREMCKLMELCEKETRLILDRFCSGFSNKTVEQCTDYIPIDQQKFLLPILITKVRGWMQHNTGFFSLDELESITKYKVLNDKELEILKKTRG